LKPAVLIGCVIEDELGHHAESAAMCFANEVAEVGERTIERIDSAIGRDVVTIIAQRRRIKWQQPDASDSKILQVIELLN